MFIAHAPASYLFSRFLINHFLQDSFTDKERAWLIAGCVLAGVLPDIDLLFFYLVDNRQHNHHSYLTHIPFFWVSLMSICFFISKVLNRKKLCVAVIVLTINLLLHFILDTLCGSIRWLYPFSLKAFSLVTIPATHHWWVWNFVLHWTFTIELLILTFAIYTFTKKQVA